MPALALSGVMAAGCDIGGYQFVQDTRLQFISPQPNATVGIPVNLRWSMRGGLPAGERFAVFVDEAPVAPGHALAHGDPQVISTTSTRCTIRTLGVEENSAAQEHEVIIVLVNTSRVRLGESQWSLLFKDRSVN
jgi:hypothetical protein